MFSAGLHANICAAQRSTLSVTGGGKQRPDGTFEFLTWELDQELKQGDRLAFSFEDGTESSPKGELDTEEIPPELKNVDFFAPLPEAELSQLEAREKLNPACCWRVTRKGAPDLVTSLDNVRQCMNLQILWNETLPNRIRVSLSKSSLREVSSQSGGEELFQSYLEIGASIEAHIEI